MVINRTLDTNYLIDDGTGDGKSVGARSRYPATATRRVRSSATQCKRPTAPTFVLLAATRPRAAGCPQLSGLLESFDASHSVEPIRSDCDRKDLTRGLG